MHDIMQPVLLYITAPSREEAILLARELLGRKVIACANIMDNVQSLYWWDGEIEQSKEIIVIAKTFSVHVERVTQIIKEQHSYECPAILAVPVTGGNDDYIQWMNTQIITGNT